MELQKYLFRGVQKNACIIFAISIIYLVFTACSSDNSTTSPSNKLNENVGSQEFQFNYRYLYYLYIDQAKYLKSPANYIGKANTNVMSQKGIPWDYYDIYYMYDQMNDYYTYYVDPLRAKDIRNKSKEKIDAGFSLDSLYIPEKYIIKNVVENSPADKAGLKIGDEIVEIEGIVPTNETVYNRLADASKGETITYTIKRGNVKLTIPVKIAPYYTPTIELSFKESIPIIKINEFTTNTSNDFGSYGEFIKYLQATEQYSATIIDLRNNGGGDGDQCIAMASTLLSKGDTIIGVITAYADSVRQRQAFDTTFKINEYDGIAKDRYFVFLANEYTASCSEIMIAGVVLNKEYPVVGRTTYGKGVGQKYFTTPSYSLISITNTKIIDKQKSSYHKFGIEPDFNIYDEEIALNVAVELAKEKTFKRIAGYGTVNTGHFTKTAITPDTMPGFYTLPDEYRKIIKY